MQLANVPLETEVGGTVCQKEFTDCQTPNLCIGGLMLYSLNYVGRVFSCNLTFFLMLFTREEFLSLLSDWYVKAYYVSKSLHPNYFKAVPSPNVHTPFEEEQITLFLSKPDRKQCPFDCTDYTFICVLLKELLTDFFLTFSTLRSNYFPLS